MIKKFSMKISHDIRVQYISLNDILDQAGAAVINMNTKKESYDPAILQEPATDMEIWHKNRK